MYVRALIVVLVILNAGAALWWATQPALPRATAPPPASGGGGRLELVPTPTATPTPAAPPAAETLVPPPPVPAAEPDAAPEGEQPPVAESVPAAAIAAPPPPAPVATPVREQCLSLGPFASRAEADAALVRGRSRVTRSRVREVAGGEPASFRVLLPAVGSREAAEALIKRIVAAGFGDYYLVSQGDRDNTVALGQYRSREGAERRQAALVAAGFPAQLVPNPGSTPSRWWIDLATSAPSAAGLGDFRGVPQRSLDCAALR